MTPASQATPSDAEKPDRPRLLAPGAVLFGLFMVAAGIGHFVAPEFYLRIMPPWLPWHEALVALSGVCEVVAGILVLIPRTRRVGGLFAIAVLLGVFPANVWMAVDPSVWPEVPTWARWARLPLQAIPILWAWFAAVRAG